MGEYDEYGYDAYGNYDYGAAAGTYEDPEAYTSYYGYDPAPEDTFDYSYSGYGLEDLGDGFWYDPADGGVYDSQTDEWTYEEYPDAAAAEDFTAMGYDDLGDGFWYDPADGSVYDSATGTWTYAEEAAGTGYTDPFGNTFYSDGSIEFPDGSVLDPSGAFHVADGGTLSADGSSWTDESGNTWENMAWADAPSLWQNTTTGDVWNNDSGQITYAVEPDTVYTDPASLVRGPDGAWYSRDSFTQPTSRPASSSGGSSGGGGGGAPTAAPAKVPPGVTLNDINKLLQSVAQTKNAFTAAKQNVSRAQTPQQSAAAKAQLASAQAAYQQALAAKNSATGGIPKEAIWIAAGLGAVLLLTTLTRPQYAPAKIKAA